MGPMIGSAAAALLVFALAPAYAQSPADALRDALHRSTLPQDRAYAFSARWDLGYTVGDSAKRCHATSRYRPPPLPESGRDDEVIVAARRASRVNDWDVTAAGDSDCVRLLRSFLEDVREARDRGDGTLFVETGESRVGALTVVEDTPERLIVEGPVEPTATTPRAARNALKGLVRRYEISKATQRIEAIRHRSARPRRVLAGLAIVRSVQTTAQVARFAGQCCVETEASSAMEVGMLGADIRLQMQYRLTSLEPQ